MSTQGEGADLQQQLEAVRLMLFDPSCTDDFGHRLLAFIEDQLAEDDPCRHDYEVLSQRWHRWLTLSRDPEFARWEHDPGTVELARREAVKNLQALADRDLRERRDTDG